MSPALENNLFREADIKRFEHIGSKRSRLKCSEVAILRLVVAVFHRVSWNNELSSH